MQVQTSPPTVREFHIFLTEQEAFFLADEINRLSNASGYISETAKGCKALIELRHQLLAWEPKFNAHR